MCTRCLKYLRGTIYNSRVMVHCILSHEANEVISVTRNRKHKYIYIVRKITNQGYRYLWEYCILKSFSSNAYRVKISHVTKSFTYWYQNIYRKPTARSHEFYFFNRYFDKISLFFLSGFQIILIKICLCFCIIEIVANWQEACQELHLTNVTTHFRILFDPDFNLMIKKLSNTFWEFFYPKSYFNQ